MGCNLSILARSSSKEPQDTEWSQRPSSTSNEHDILPLTPKAESAAQEEKEAREKAAEIKEVRTRESIPLELMRAEKSASIQQKHVNAKALAKLEGRA